MGEACIIMFECIADGLCDGLGEAFIMLWPDIIACDEGLGDGDGVTIESAIATVPEARASAAASPRVRAFKLNLQNKSVLP